MQTDKIKSWDRLIEKEDERDVSLSVWRAMIEQISKDDISSAKILDFGCDRGGFLRMLYDAKPFKKAVGVECATDKAAVANQLRGKRPIYYGHDDELSAHKSSFDYAFWPLGNMQKTHSGHAGITWCMRNRPCHHKIIALTTLLKVSIRQGLRSPSIA